jgi:hypothetical protein
MNHSDVLDRHLDQARAASFQRLVAWQKAGVKDS